MSHSFSFCTADAVFNHLYPALAFSQFESEPASVALDNTTVECFGDEFSPATDLFTKAGFNAYRMGRWVRECRMLC
jgi:hypothetical protein